MEKTLQQLHSKCERAMRKRDYIHVRNWPPSAHEEFVRGIHPRGFHYDPADDGPEVYLVNAYIDRAAQEFLDSIPGRAKKAFDMAQNFIEHWLNVGPSWPPDGEVDTLSHRRE